MLSLLPTRIVRRYRVEGSGPRGPALLLACLVWAVASPAPARRKPDLAALVQEVVDRPGWNAGNSLALLVTGSGARVADSYDGGAAGAAVLVVEYLE